MKKEETVQEIKVQPVVKEEVAKPVIFLNFDVWFSSLGKPMHHKAGMKAFAPTAGKRTVDQWKELFKNY